MEPTYLAHDGGAIRALIFSTCAILDCMELAPLIRVEWNRAFTARLGDANFKLNRIRLSVPLMQRADVEQRRVTIIHEACHLVAVHKHGPMGRGHGSVWASCMHTCGLAADRCHKVDNAGLRRKPAGVPATCACSTYQLSVVRAAKQLSGRARYFCKKCRQVLTLSPATNQLAALAKAST